MLRNREGFTLIELLIVVVIIGILAAIALPKFGQTREAAYYTTMKADLNNLRSAQEMEYQTSGDFTYVETLDELAFTPSSGVLITDDDITLVEGGQAWTAVAAHQALTDVGCAIAFGDFVNEDGTPAAPGVSTPGGYALTANDVGAPVCDDNLP